jgi:hypothetical protein
MAQFLLLALAGMALGHQQTPAAAPEPFVTPQDIGDLTRLALTPKLDGVIDTEEWDPFIQTGDLDSYLQWEPGILYLAAKAPIGDEIVYSFDLKNDGWLVGRDNLEVRLRRSEAGVTIKGRVLDADNKTGPKWIDVPGISIASNVASSVSDDGKTWTVEAALNDPGTGYFLNSAGRIGARVDAIPMDGAEAASYLPRAVAQIKLGFRRATGLPGGVIWEPEHEGQYVQPGAGMHLRYTFRGENAGEFQRVAMRSEGFAKDATNSLEVPFPKLDKKNRAFVDFDTKVATGSTEGYRVARCVVTSKDGATSMGQASYRISPALDMQLVPVSSNQTHKAALLKVTVYLRSNSQDKFRGTFHMTPPTGFTILTGNDMPFVLYKTQTVRRVLQMSVPSNAVGTFPFELHSKVGNDEYNDMGYLTIQY